MHKQDALACTATGAHAKAHRMQSSYCVMRSRLLFRTQNALRLSRRQLQTVQQKADTCRQQLIALFSLGNLQLSSMTQRTCKPPHTCCSEHRFEHGILHPQCSVCIQQLLRCLAVVAAGHRDLAADALNDRRQARCGNVPVQDALQAYNMLQVASSSSPGIDVAAAVQAPTWQQQHMPQHVQPSGAACNIHAQTASI
jgi:hypothetical protein